MTNDQNITPAILLQHMQGMEKRMKEEMKKGFKSVDQRFETVDAYFNEIKKRLEHLEQDVFILIAHKKAHEERLDHIEKVKLPRIRKSVRNVSKKLSDHIASHPLHPALQH